MKNSRNSPKSDLRWNLGVITVMMVVIVGVSIAFISPMESKWVGIPLAVIWGVVAFLIGNRFLR